MFYNWTLPIRRYNRSCEGLVFDQSKEGGKKRLWTSKYRFFARIYDFYFQFNAVAPSFLLPLLVESWKPQHGCSYFRCGFHVNAFRLYIISPLVFRQRSPCYLATYDVRKCGRGGSDSQPEPVFNDGLLQPEPRVFDPGERTCARSAPSL